jgi:hypothetical protein
MEIMQKAPPTSSHPIPRSRGRLWLWLGIGLCLLGIVFNFVQILLLKHLVTPWYLPIMATAGVLLALVSVRLRPTWVRIVGLVLLALLTGLEWFFLLSLARLPEYKGPVEIGRKIPEFTTTLADGRPFTAKDLQQGIPTVLVFYRGHW